MTLTYRPPFDWQRMLDFYQARAIPGVECVEDGVYHRTVRIYETFGTISVSHSKTDNALRLKTALSDSVDLMPLVERVRRMFDLDANMAAIHKVFAADPLLGQLVNNRPGLRLPGAWDPFEVAIRAVVGQQISVKGARTVIGRIVAKAGPQIGVHGASNLTHYFPIAKELDATELGHIGMPAKRAATIKTIARHAASGDISLRTEVPMEAFLKQLTRIPGIGDWTAQYIAMRALGEPDAFPAADLGIARALQQGDKRPTPKQIIERAENWRPWRSYAAVYLWHA